MSNLCKLVLALATVCVGAVLAAATLAPAASAQTGATAVANCQRLEYAGTVRHYIKVTAPRLNANYDMLTYPNGYVLHNPLQWVKFTVHLNRYEQGAWRWLNSSPTFYQQVRANASSQPGAWQYYNGQRWVLASGSHEFNILRLSGLAYRVSMEVEWLPFYGQVGYEKIPNHWIPHMDDRKGPYNMAQDPWCVY